MNKGYVVLALISLLLGCFFYFTGIHNVDLSSNMMVKLAEEGKNFREYHDMSGNNITKSYVEGYQMGMNYLWFGFIFTLMAGLYFGVVLGDDE